MSWPWFAPAFTADQIPSLAGKVVLITGCSSGLGRETALQLALHGAKLYLATRNEAKTLNMITQFEEKHPELKGSGRLLWIKMDLSLVKSCEAAAQEFLSKEERLDLLVCNGGEAGKYGVTEENVSRTFAANYLGHYALTLLLLPLLERTALLPGADVRIVSVSSTVHTMAPADTTFSDLESFRLTGGPERKREGMMIIFARYGQSKLAQVLFTKALQRRMDAKGVPILAMSLHPGSVSTEGTKGIIGPYLNFITSFFFLTPHQGALTSLFCATSSKLAPGAPEREKYKGAYVVPYGKVDPGSEKSRDAAMAERLWGLSEGAVGEIAQKGRI